MDYLNSFFQNIKDKLTNPFFGTFILILIIHHWEFWYTIFNFDANASRNFKINVLRTLVNYEFTVRNFFIDIMWAIIISVGGYIIVVITRTLSLFIEFRIMPWITGKVVNKNVVLKSTHDETVVERDEYSDKYEEQRKNVRIISKNYDEQIELIKTKDVDLATKSIELSKLTKNLNNSRQKAEGLENDLKKSLNNTIVLESNIDDLKNRQTITLNNLDEFKNLFFSVDNKFFWNSEHKFPPAIIEKVRELNNDGDWLHFLNVGKFVEFGGNISGESLTEMKEKGLLYDGIHTEEFTPIGEIIYKYKSILGDVV